MALVFPSPGLIQRFGELELFWVQHYTTGLICPLVLALNGRFTKNFHMGFSAVLYVKRYLGFPFYVFIS
jgi:hypothetical protein